MPTPSNAPDARRLTPDALFQPAIEPIPNGREPQLRVLRLQDPVTFVREVEQLRRDAAALEGGEELQSFADRNAVIKLAVRHESRCGEVFHEAVRRPFIVLL